MDQVVTEAAEAAAGVEARRGQLKHAKQAVVSATDSYRRNRKLFTDGGIELILPIEVLQSASALTRAQQDFLTAVVEYNRAQLQLHWALGFPVESVTEAATDSNE